MSSQISKWNKAVCWFASACLLVLMCFSGVTPAQAERETGPTGTEQEIVQTDAGQDAAQPGTEQETVQASTGQETIQPGSKQETVQDTAGRETAPANTPSGAPAAEPTGTPDKPVASVQEADIPAQAADDGAPAPVATGGVIRLEAEDGPFGEPKADRGFVENINTTGQGFEVKTPADIAAGEYILTVYYMTDAPTAYHEVFVGTAEENLTTVGKVAYTEKTGWYDGPYHTFVPAILENPVTLTAGENIIRVIKSSDSDGYAQVDYITLTPLEPGTAATFMTIEAESGAHVGKANSAGRAYFADIDNPGDGFVLTVTVPEAATYDLVAYYMSGSNLNPATHSVRVNGKLLEDKLHYNENNGWDDVGIALPSTSVSVTLHAGPNTIFIGKLEEDVMFAQVDRITLTLHGTVKIEAESGALFGNAMTNYSPYASNGGYVRAIDNVGAGVTLTAKGMEAGTYKLTVNYTSDKIPGFEYPYRHQVSVNGVFAGDVYYPASTGGWGDQVPSAPAELEQELVLREGDNTITLMKVNSASYVELDYIFLTRTGDLPRQEILKVEAEAPGSEYHDGAAPKNSPFGGLTVIGDFDGGHVGAYHTVPILINQTGRYKMAVSFTTTAPNSTLTITANKDSDNPQTGKLKNGDTISNTYATDGALAALPVTVMMDELWDLNEGWNYLRIDYTGEDTGWIEVDYFLLIREADLSAVELAVEPENEAEYGENVTLTATVTGEGDAPTGTVEFFYDGTSLGKAAVEDGTATLTTTQIPVGEWTLTASYSGDKAYWSAESNEVAFTVIQEDQTLYTVTLSDETKAHGTVTVEPGNASAGTIVTITITPPEQGYRPGEVRVLKGGTEPIGVSGSGNVRTFTMPANDVTVEVVWNIIWDEGLGKEGAMEGLTSNESEIIESDNADSWKVKSSFAKPDVLSEEDLANATIIGCGVLYSNVEIGDKVARMVENIRDIVTEAIGSGKHQMTLTKIGTVDTIGSTVYMGGMLDMNVECTAEAQTWTNTFNGIGKGQERYARAWIAVKIGEEIRIFWSDSDVIMRGEVSEEDPSETD